MTTHHLSDDLRHVPLFAALPESALEALGRVSVQRSYPDGHILCHEGDLGEMLYVLLKGEIRVSRMTLDGREIVVAIVEAPGALGELSLIDSAPRSATLTAQGPVSVRLIPRSAFLQLFSEQPALRDTILHRLATMLRNSNQLHVDMLSLDVPGRLAKWLLQRYERHAGSSRGGPVTFQIGRTQTDLATELGTTRSTLNRALHGFEDLELISIQGDLITVIGPEELAAYTT
ncbi:MAG: Crp/Fnr family transcriptional regulator [Thermomicrobiales bacterium]|nr:Crp/Fnr family transcriptional regulator [Thermomicrobiales bacterium]